MGNRATRPMNEPRDHPLEERVAAFRRQITNPRRETLRNYRTFFPGFLRERGVRGEQLQHRLRMMSRTEKRRDGLLRLLHVVFVYEHYPEQQPEHPYVILMANGYGSYRAFDIQELCGKVRDIFGVAENFSIMEAISRVLNARAAELDGMYFACAHDHDVMIRLISRCHRLH